MSSNRRRLERALPARVLWQFAHLCSTIKEQEPSDRAYLLQLMNDCDALIYDELAGAGNPRQLRGQLDRFHRDLFAGVKNQRRTVTETLLGFSLLLKLLEVGGVELGERFTALYEEFAAAVEEKERNRTRLAEPGADAAAGEIARELAERVALLGWYPGAV